MKSSVAKVLLADDHVLYRECLRGLFERWDDFQVVGEASNGAEALDLCRQLKPDLVLMDVSMPVLSGIDAAKTIVKEMPEATVVMLTASLEEDSLIAAMQSGARGFLLKNIHGYQLRNRLREALGGETVLSGDVILKCLDIIRSKRSSTQLGFDASGMLSTLTDQEREILLYVALGESNKEIGARLYIGESTVKKRFSVILAKLGLENRVQAAVFALHAGLIE